MDWFLYDNDLRHERVKAVASCYVIKVVLDYCKMLRECCVLPQFFVTS